MTPHAPGLRRAAVAAAAALLIAAPSTVLADGATRGRILVPGDHFKPGDIITISGSELIESSEVVIRLQGGPTIVELGRATVAPDATLSTAGTIPASFPLGYAELTVRDESGNVWSTFVLIGDRAEGPADAAASPPIDDRWPWLIVLAVGLIVFAVAAVSALRGRPTPPAG